MEEEPPNFGAELKDAFKPVNSWVQSGIAWMSDIESFYRDRAAIERDYSARLQELAKKYFDKKARKSATLSVGETPLLTPGSLECASLTTWGSLLSATELMANEHDKLATEMLTHCAETTKTLFTKYEDFRQRHEKFERKLVTERDSQYSDLKKSKGAYDAICREVEDKRVKVEKSPDSSRAKAERGYQAQIAEMNNVKNSYLIAINVTNAHKEKYYHSDIPDVLSSLQDLNETRVRALNSLWSLYCSMSIASQTKCNEHLTTLSSEITRNDPHLDSLMFIKHNSNPDGSWPEPADFIFEPSPIWHDTSEIAVDDAAKVWLQNKISKSKTGLETQRKDVDIRRREIETLKRRRETLRGKGNPAGGKQAAEEIDAMKSILAAQEDLITIDNKRVLLEVEVNTVREACGDIDRGAQQHKFKSASFKIPTACDLCGDKIWGLSAKGLSCTDCGYTCHTKCEMKVPASCPGILDKNAKKALKEERLKKAAEKEKEIDLSISDGASTLERSSTTASQVSSTVGRSETVRSSISSSVPKRRVLAPPPEKYVTATELPAEVPTAPAELPASNETMAKMLYTFAGTGDGELAVSEGDRVTVVEPDDGSGWIRVKGKNGEGLVPAAYAEVLPQTAAAFSPTSDRPSSSYSNASQKIGSIGKKKGPAVAPKRGAKKLTYVEALYDYRARTDDEFDMTAGDKFVLITDDTGDGWAEVEKGGERKSVPANYVQKCAG